MKKELKDVERTEVETDVSVIDAEEVEEEVKFEDEPKLGPVKRIKKRMREFSERHPRAVSVLKGIGVFGVAFITGFAVATVNEKQKRASEGIADSNCVLLPEDNCDINVDETVNNIEEIPDIDISSES